MPRFQVRAAALLTMTQGHVQAGIVAFLTCLNAFFHFRTQWMVHVAFPLLSLRDGLDASVAWPLQLPPNFTCNRMKTM